MPRSSLLLLLLHSSRKGREENDAWTLCSFLTRRRRQRQLWLRAESRAFNRYFALATGTTKTPTSSAESTKHGYCLRGERALVRAVLVAATRSSLCTPYARAYTDTALEIPHSLSFQSSQRYALFDPPYPAELCVKLQGVRAAACSSNLQLILNSLKVSLNGAPLRCCWQDRKLTGIQPVHSGILKIAKHNPHFSCLDGKFALHAGIVQARN